MPTYARLGRAHTELVYTTAGGRLLPGLVRPTACAGIILTGNEAHVVYHVNHIACWNSDQICLRNHGHMTFTTKVRMNQAANQFMLGFKVFQRSERPMNDDRLVRNWYVEFRGQTIPFQNGLILYRRENGPTHRTATRNENTHTQESESPAPAQVVAGVGPLRTVESMRSEATRVLDVAYSFIQRGGARSVVAQDTIHAWNMFNRWLDVAHPQGVNMSLETNALFATMQRVEVEERPYLHFWHSVYSNGCRLLILLRRAARGWEAQPSSYRIRNARLVQVNAEVDRIQATLAGMLSHIESREHAHTSLMVFRTSRMNTIEIAHLSRQHEATALFSWLLVPPENRTNTPTQPHTIEDEE